MPPTATERLVGPTAYVQPAWITVKVRPAMVSVPVRAAALAKFESTEKVTWRLPLPLGLDVMAIQGSLLAAVQGQPAGALTAVAALGMPVTATERLVGRTAYVQPAWLTVKVRPAMVSVPVRARALVEVRVHRKGNLAIAASARARCDGDPGVIAGGRPGASRWRAHGRPAALGMPATATERPVGDIVGAQPAWVTVKIWPAMVIVAVRGVALPKFEPTSKTTLALPLPVPPDVMASQLALPGDCCRPATSGGRGHCRDCALNACGRDRTARRRDSERAADIADDAMDGAAERRPRRSRRPRPRRTTRC